MAVCSSFREFVGTKPPLVVFFATIATFALTLVSVSLYLQDHKTEILNPDIKDWNSFYSTLSNLEICFPTKGSSKVAKMKRPRREVPLEMKVAGVGVSPSLPALDTTNLTLATNTSEANITVSVLADVQVLKARRHLVGVTLHALVPAKYLGLNLKRDPSVLDVTLELASKSAKNWTSCVVLTGPAHLLPDSPISPANCTATRDKEQLEVDMGSGWLAGRPEWCQEGGVEGNLIIAPQDELNVYLTEGDITLIQLHILYTTVVLCLTLVLVLGYLVCGRRWCCLRLPPTTTGIPADKVPLNP